MSIWILLIPFFVFLLNGLAGHKYKTAYAGIIGTSGLFISWLLSLAVGIPVFLRGRNEKRGLSADHRL